MKFKLTVIISVLVSLVQLSSAWGSSHQKVKLTDIQTLTLRDGQMTTGRRNSPMPQLNCVGGTAAHLFKPQVVQCYNRGSDGYDVQWECKTDMDNAYRFGTVEVVCEGYDYSDDKYILKGSCALEYTLDLTKEGYQQQQRSGHHDYYSGQSHKEPAYEKARSDSKSKSGTGDFIIILVVGVVIYAIYKTCIRMPNSADDTGSDIPPDQRGTGFFGGGGGWGGGGSGGPAPGFRPEYMPDDSCSGTSRRASSGSGGGGFWTGAATGGILGYMLGNRGNQGSTGYGFRAPPPAYSSHHAFGGTGNDTYSSGSSSTGTRSASGFGGTRRR